VRVICAALLAAAASGCVSSYRGSAREADPGLLQESGWQAVRGVPLILQQSRADCGGAALAMVLGYLGTSADPAQIASGRAVALRDFARSRGFDSFVVPASLEHLEAEIAGGRPILVGVVKPQMDGAVPHYEVVVGIDRAGSRIATLDPARGLTVNSLEGFDREWKATRRLAIVILPKGIAPRGASR
jgi:ABC-type bacteriocin/lantibiotic exporter with double-glycine peptidase domain